jgi:hypothetical protein
MESSFAKEHEKKKKSSLGKAESLQPWIFTTSDSGVKKYLSFFSQNFGTGDREESFA